MNDDDDVFDFASWGRELGSEAAARIAEAIAGVVPSFVEVPVRWCTVHACEECDETYGASSVPVCWVAINELRDAIAPDPCRLVPCYINTTENPAQ